MKTREEINDHYGTKSCYVVEYSYNGRDWSIIAFGGIKKKDACKEKERLYKIWKHDYPKITTRKKFRVALYVRAGGHIK